MGDSVTVETVSSTSPLGHRLPNPEHIQSLTHTHTYNGVTSAADRNCHTAVSAGASRHRCSQRGPQSIPPPLGEFKPAVQRD